MSDGKIIRIERKNHVQRRDQERLLGSISRDLREPTVLRGRVTRVYSPSFYDVLILGRDHPYTRVPTTGPANFRIGDTVVLGFLGGNLGVPLIIAPPRRQSPRMLTGGEEQVVKIYLWATALGQSGGWYNVPSIGGTDFGDAEENNGLQGYIYRTSPTHLVACDGTKFYRYASIGADPEEFLLGDDFSDYVGTFALTYDAKIIAVLSSSVALYEWGGKDTIWSYTPTFYLTAGDAIELGDSIFIPLRDTSDNLQYARLELEGKKLWESSIDWKSRVGSLPSPHTRTVYYPLTDNAYKDYQGGHQQDRSQSSKVILGEITQTTTQLIPRARGAEYVPAIDKKTGQVAWELRGWDDFVADPGAQGGYSYIELYSLTCTYGNLCLFFASRIGWHKAPDWEMPIVTWAATKYAISESSMEALDESASDENFSSLSGIFATNNDPSRNPSFTIHWPVDPEDFTIDGLADVADSIESNTNTDTVEGVWNFASAKHEYRTYDPSGAKVGSAPPTTQGLIVDGTKKISKYRLPKGAPLGYVTETWHFTRDKPNPYRADDSDPFTWTSLSTDWTIVNHDYPNPIPSGKMPAVQYMIARQEGIMIMPNYDAILPGTPTSAPHHGVPGTQRPDGTWTADGAVKIMAPYKSGTRTVEVPMYSYGYPKRSEVIYTSDADLLASDFKVEEMTASRPYSTEGATIEIGIFADTDDDGTWDMDVEYPKDKPDIDCRFLAKDVWVTAYTYYYDWVEIPIEVDAWPPYNPVDGTVIGGEIVFPPGKANLEGDGGVIIG